jgi:hypothetical protein
MNTCFSDWKDIFMREQTNWWVVGCWHWGACSPSTVVSPANSNSTICATLIKAYHRRYIFLIMTASLNSQLTK